MRTMPITGNLSLRTAARCPHSWMKITAAMPAARAQPNTCGINVVAVFGQLCRVIRPDPRCREFQRIAQIRRQIAVSLFAAFTRNRPVGIIHQRVAIKPLRIVDQRRIAARLHFAQNVGHLARNIAVGFAPGINNPVEPHRKIGLEG